MPSRLTSWIQAGLKMILLVCASVVSVSAARADDVIADNVAIVATTSNGAFLEFIQTNSAGHAPWQWEMLGFPGSTLWFKDVHGSRLPFLFNGSPLGTLVVAGNGNFGIDTPAPATAFHVNHVAESKAELLARFGIETLFDRLELNNGSATNGVYIPRIQGITFSANSGLILEGLTSDGGGSPVIVHNAVKASGGGLVNRPLAMYRNNGLQMVMLAANGDLFATSFSPISSRQRKKNIIELDLATAIQALRQLTPVEFVYKEDPTEKKRLGFIAEDVPDLIANADRKTVPIMDAVALVTQVARGHQAGQAEIDRSLKRQTSAMIEQREELASQHLSIEQTRKLLKDQQQAIQAQSTALDLLQRRIEDLNRQETR